MIEEAAVYRPLSNCFEMVNFYRKAMGLRQIGGECYAAFEAIATVQGQLKYSQKALARDFELVPVGKWAQGDIILVAHPGHVGLMVVCERGLVQAFDERTSKPRLMANGYDTLMRMGCEVQAYR